MENERNLLRDKLTRLEKQELTLIEDWPDRSDRSDSASPDSPQKEMNWNKRARTEETCRSSWMIWTWCIALLKLSSPGRWLARTEGRCMSCFGAWRWELWDGQTHKVDFSADKLVQSRKNQTWIQLKVSWTPSALCMKIENSLRIQFHTSLGFVRYPRNIKFCRQDKYRVHTNITPSRKNKDRCMKSYYEK
jgi:hypothetical protein